MLNSGYFHNHCSVFLEPPHWVEEPIKTKVLAIGSKVEIKCQASGKPPPTINWMRNGEPLQGNTYSNTFRIHMQNDS